MIGTPSSIRCLGLLKFRFAVDCAFRRIAQVHGTRLMRKIFPTYSDFDSTSARRAFSFFRNLGAFGRFWRMGP